MCGEKDTVSVLGSKMCGEEKKNIFVHVSHIEGKKWLLQGIQSLNNGNEVCGEKRIK